MSALAPWMACQREGVLLLTDESGADVKARVAAAVARPELAKVDRVILLGDLKALPMDRRPNPLAGGKDEFIELEPLAPTGNAPFSFAVGRMFHRDAAIVALMLARQRLVAQTPQRALVVSNPGGGLPLLETLSRNTVQEMRHAGLDTTTIIGREADRRAKLRRLLPEQTIFLWEGHQSTLFRDYGVHEWPEPLRPSLIFLQSCLSLAEEKTHPFLERGAVGVIGSSSRTYSGSGGGLSLAYFDALLYEEQTLGGALRHAKNFMLAFAQLKLRRLGGGTSLGGANVRAAWAFSLWGDPTIKLPLVAHKPDTLVAPRVRGNSIVVSLPDETHEKVDSGRFAAQMRPNARLAGLVKKSDDAHQLVPLIFAEVPLPKAPAGRVPQLRTRLPERNWVFCWDERRRVGWLLAIPRAGDRELRFTAEWQLADALSVVRSPP